MLESLISLDTKLFFFLIGLHSSILDNPMYWASNIFFWIPLFVFIVALLIKTYGKQSILLIISIAILITLSDQISSHLIKDTLVKRLRPSNEPAYLGLIHLSDAGPGGTYGFVSGHAANAFALATFLFFLFRNKYIWFNLFMLSCAVFVSYSRIYNGVHYPADVIGGAIVGVFLGWGIFKLYAAVLKRLSKNSE
jgi:undecaprenyl-diphosphatase